jgi:alpha-mannosidase
VDRRETAVGGESLIRHCVIGKRLLRELFGYDSEVALHPDLPSYAPQLPQIYSKAGIRYYLTSRKSFPDGQVFRFQAPDGSSTLHSHFIQSYTYLPLDELAGKIDQFATGFPAGRLVAAGGGGDLCGRDTFPGRRGGQLENLIERGKQQYPFLDFSYTTLAEVMRDYAQGEYDLPVRSGEAPSNWGSIMSNSPEMWSTSRAAEGEVLDAELLGGLARAWLDLDPVPPERGTWLNWRYESAFWLAPEHIERGREFEELWKLALVPQDHNDGSREGPETEFQKLQMNKRARDYAGLITRRCLEALAGGTGVTEGEKSIIVFNQASWERAGLVQLEDTVGGGACVLDEHGEEMPSQVTVSPHGPRLWFLAKAVPALGYRSFSIEDRPLPPTSPAGPARESGDSIVVDTGCLDLSFRKTTGCFEHVRFSGSGSEIIAQRGLGWGNVRALTENGMDVAPKIDEKVSPENMKVGEVSVASSGPVFTEVVVRGTLCGSALEQRWRIYTALPRVDLEMNLLWWGKPNMQLRLDLPLAEDFAQIVYDTPFYANTWPQVMEGSGPWQGDEMSREEWMKYREVVSWVDLSNGESGVTIGSRHGHYYIDGPNLQVVLLRSAICCGDKRRYRPNAGDRRWKFSFTFHEGDWKRGAAYQRGFEAVRPLMAAPAERSASAGLPATHSFLSLEPSHLVVSAVKSPYDGDGRDLVVRFVEMEGKGCIARLQVSGTLKEAFETNLLEEDQHHIALDSANAVRVQVKPYEIKTLRLSLESERRR